MSGAPAVPSTLEARLAAWWRDEGGPDPRAPLLLALSGGLDSTVLLHLLVRTAPSGTELHAAHLDHAMRDGSAADARAVEAHCRELGVPLVLERASPPPRSEAAARTLRYDFLHRTARSLAAGSLLTAHHEDDQVETIFFRILRGTGLRGLAGIPRARRGPWLHGSPARPGRVLRPLLGVARSELEAWAADRGLPVRDDPTNLDPTWSRNRLRLEVMPLLESVHPGAREGILRLGRNARATEEALDALLTPLVRALLLPDDGDGGVRFDRGAFLRAPAPVSTQLLRHLARRAGVRLDETGTAGALEFIRAGPVRGGVDLTGGARLERSGGILRLTARTRT